MDILKISLIFILCIACRFTVQGIKCYQCNSIENSACTHLEDNGTIIFPTPCNFTDNVINYTEPDDNSTEPRPFCRKTVLSYLDFDRQKHNRVVRSCGMTRFKRDCYVATNDDHEEIVCQCETDGCNGSSSIYPSIKSCVMILLSLTYLTYF